MYRSHTHVPDVEETALEAERALPVRGVVHSEWVDLLRHLLVGLAAHNPHHSTSDQLTLMEAVCGGKEGERTLYWRAISFAISESMIAY